MTKTQKNHSRLKGVPLCGWGRRNHVPLVTVILLEPQQWLLILTAMWSRVASARGNFWMRAFRIFFTTRKMVNHVILESYTIYHYHKSLKNVTLKMLFYIMNSSSYLFLNRNE